MSDLEALLAIDFESFASEQYETIETNDGARRIPTALMGSGNYDTAKAPYIRNHATGFGYNLKGLHPDITGTDNGRASAAWYLPALAPEETLVSFVQVRLFGGAIHMGVGPAVRMETAGTPGRGCYAAELTWNALTQKFDLVIVKYAATTGTRSILSTLAGAISAYPTGGVNFGDRYYAVGLKATGTGTVSLQAFLHMMFYTGQPSYNPFAPGNSPPRHLSALPSNLTPVLTATDASSPHASGAHGIRWRDETGGFNVTAAHTQSRLCLEWGLFRDISGTRPQQPQNLTSASTNAVELTVYAPQFADSDPLDTHASTRWLLFSDSGVYGFDVPLRDTGFLTGSKTSYLFDDLAPGGRYRVQCQFRDSDGDISKLSDFIFCTVAGGVPKGVVAIADFHGSLPYSRFPRHGPFAYFERASIAEATPFFKLRDAGFVPGTSPTIGQGTTIRRFDSVAASGRQGVTFRVPALVQGNPGSRYGSVMATMVFVKWGDDTGLQIGVRQTASDTNGFFVIKKADGSGYWTYEVYRRALNAGGVPGVGPWTETLLFSKTIVRNACGRNGERVILAHYDANGSPVVALWVNGQFFGQATDAYLAEWLNDPGHAWSSVVVGDENGDWDVASYGQVEPVTGQYPELPILVTAPARDTGSLSGGSGLNHVGPFMDPFDLNQEFCAWFSVDGKWAFMDVAGVGAFGFLVYWAPYLASYDYAIRSALYNRNGLVGRFTDAQNYIAAYWNAGGTLLNLALVVSGIVVAAYEAVCPFVAADELVLQIANDTDPNSTALTIRVYYDSLQLTFGLSGGPYDTTTVVYDGGASSPLRSGRFGFVRNGLNGASTGEYVGGDLLVSSATAGAAPDAPTITTKTGDTASKVSVILSASAFIDADQASVHAASQWQVTTNADPTFAAVVYDTGVDVSNLTAVTVPSLDASTTYRARLRYRDDTGLWSPWSDTFTFTTDAVDTTGQPTNGLPVFPLDPKPAQTFARLIEFDNVVTKFTGGRRQAVAQRTGGLHRFTLEFGPLDAARIDTIWNFYVARSGNLEQFVYVDQTTGVAHVCAFSQAALSREMFEWKIERTGLELDEVKR